MIVLRVLSLSLLLCGAQTDSWILLRGINAGQDTHVHTTDGRTHKGGFVSVDDSAIVIREKLGDERYEKTAIRKVSVRKGTARARNAAIGAVAGAVPVGIILWRSGEGARIASAGATAYGLIGAGIGALFPGYHTLYRTP